MHPIFTRNLEGAATLPFPPLQLVKGARYRSHLDGHEVWLTSWLGSIVVEFGWDDGDRVHCSSLPYQTFCGTFRQVEEES